MERFKVSTMNVYETALAISSGRKMFASCVSSKAKIMLVNGARIVPPSVAPILISAQKPAPSFGRNIASSPPSAPPIISNGASTPPEVPEPSDTAQINHLTISTPRITFVVTEPCRSAPIVSYPTPSACGKTMPPRPTASPPISGHHIQRINSIHSASSYLYMYLENSAERQPASNPTSAKPTKPTNHHRSGGA